STRPRWTNVISAVAVIGFEIDASEYIVCGVASARRPRSAKPNDSSHTISDPMPTATDTDGMRSDSRMARMVSRAAAKRMVSPWAPSAGATNSSAANARANGRRTKSRVILRAASDFRVACSGGPRSEAESEQKEQHQHRAGSPDDGCCGAQYAPRDST